MRGSAIVAIVGVAAALGTPVAHARTPHPCKPRGARTIMEDQRARIYVAYNRGWLSHVLHACSFKHRRPVVLGYPGRAPEPVEEFALAYPFVAATTSTFALGPGYRIEVFDLRRGRYAYGDVGAYEASDLVLSRHGVAAWIATSGGHNPGPRGVWKLAGERKELLDPGAVDVGSLALSGSHRRLYWMRGGVPSAADLGP